MPADSYLVDEFTVRDLATFYARRNDLANVRATLALCQTEYPDHLAYVQLLCIQEFAVAERHAHADTLVRALRAMPGLGQALFSAIPRFVQSGVSAAVPAILHAVQAEPKYANCLLNEMVQQAVPAAVVDDTCQRLHAVGLTTATHFDVYRVGVWSESPRLIHAILRHMHATRMQMADAFFDGAIRLAAKSGGEAALLATLKQLHAWYGFKPSMTFIRAKILVHLPWPEHPAAAIDSLRSAKLSRRACVLSVITAFLLQQNIGQACRVAAAQATDMYLNVDVVVEPAIDAYLDGGDTVHFVRFIGLIRDSVEQIDKYKNPHLSASMLPTSLAEVRQEQRRFIGHMIERILKDPRLRDGKTVAKTLLTALNGEDFRISSESFEKIARCEVIDREALALLKSLVVE